MNIKIRVHIGFLYLLNQNFDSFGIEHIPKEINKFINNNIKSNIFRIQAYDSTMCGYFCIEFINYMLKGKTLLDYSNLFSPNNLKKNGQFIKRIFKNYNLNVIELNIIK